MKITYQKISAIAIVTLFLFTSCSRELTSIPQTNKLANVQALSSTSSGPVLVQKTGPLAQIKTASPQPAVVNNAAALASKTNDANKIAHAGKTGHSLMANTLTKKAAKQILKQISVIKSLTSSNRVASYSKTSHTESWLGLALTCLIVGIILLALGFGTLGAIFWEIGVVILVIALVFFILWLLAAAATE